MSVQLDFKKNQPSSTTLALAMPEVWIFGWRSPVWDTEREKFKIDEGWEQDDNIPLGVHDDWDLKYRRKDPKHQDLKF